MKTDSTCVPTCIFVVTSVHSGSVTKRVPRRVAGRRVLVGEHIDQRSSMPGFSGCQKPTMVMPCLRNRRLVCSRKRRMEQVNRARSFALDRVGAQLEAARIGRDVLARDSGSARWRRSRGTARGSGWGSRRLRGGGNRRRENGRHENGGKSAKMLDHLKPPESPESSRILDTAIRASV